MMCDKKILEVLAKPYGKGKRLMCSCGMLQCHGAIWCKDCGTKFEFVESNVPLFNAIIRHAERNSYRVKKGPLAGYYFMEAVFRRRFGVGEIKPSHLKVLCKQLENPNAQTK